MTSKILLVEDNESLRIGLVDNLEDEGYVVRATENGEAARVALDREPFDLVILDIMLPDVDGYTLCQEIRAAGNTAMVLMLTARTLEEDLVKGFDIGADDYLKKPYRLHELLARVRALLRRVGRGEAPRVHSFGSFRLDSNSHRVMDANGVTVPLTRTEYQLLSLLLANVDRAFSRDEILDRVWGKQVHIDGRTVDNFVSSLKRKLRWGDGAGFRIQTIRGVGYRMEVD